MSQMRNRTHVCRLTHKDWDENSDSSHGCEPTQDQQTHPIPPFLDLTPLTPVSLLKIEQPIPHIPFVISRSDMERLTQRHNDRMYKYLGPASVSTPVFNLPELKVSALQYCQASNNGNMWNQFWIMNGLSGVNRVWQRALTYMKIQFPLNAAVWWWAAEERQLFCQFDLRNCADNKKQTPAQFGQIKAKAKVSILLCPRRLFYFHVISSKKNKHMLQLEVLKTHITVAVLWPRDSEWIMQNKPPWSHK